MAMAPVLLPNTVRDLSDDSAACFFCLLVAICAECAFLCPARTTSAIQIY